MSHYWCILTSVLPCKFDDQKYCDVIIWLLDLRRLACENSRPSLLPARVTFTRAGSEVGRLFSQAMRGLV